MGRRLLPERPRANVVDVLREVVKVLLKSTYDELVEECEGISRARFVSLALAAAKVVQHALRMEEFVAYLRDLKG